MSTEAIIAEMLTLLVGVLGWNANRVHLRIDDIDKEMNSLLRRMPGDYLGKEDFKNSKAEIDKRVDKIETTILSGFHEFGKKLDDFKERIFEKLDTKQDKP